MAYRPKFKRFTARARRAYSSVRKRVYRPKKKSNMLLYGVVGIAIVLMIFKKEKIKEFWEKIFPTVKK